MAITVMKLVVLIRGKIINVNASGAAASFYLKKRVKIVVIGLAIMRTMVILMKIARMKNKTLFLL
jgi:hypothetical protein